MAPSINGLGSSGLSSIYGNRNVISGLASGMDTEAMIENAVSGYKMKISALQRKQTKVLWQQAAYRGIIDKMANFTQKYTSYTSNTNLLSASFFDNAVKTVTQGTYADKISALGKTTSDVQILGVKQLATAATYKTEIQGIDGHITGGEVDLAEKIKVSTLSGTVTLSRGNEKVELTFSEDKIYQDQAELLEDIKAQLKEADQEGKIDVKLTDKGITFTDATDGNNAVKIVDASGAIKDTLKIDPGAKGNCLEVGGMGKDDFFKYNGTIGSALSGQEIRVTLDGVSKTIKLPEYTDGMSGDQFLDGIQKSFDKAFGAGKIDIRTNSTGQTGSGKFQLDIVLTGQGSTLEISGGKKLGLSSNFETSYMNSSAKLGDILGNDFPGSGATMAAAVGKVKKVENKDGTSYYVDERGNRVKPLSDGGQDYYRVDDKGEFMYEFKVNDVVVGAFSKNSTMESVIVAINDNTDNVQVSYSKITNQLQFVAKETGSNGRIEFSGLSEKLFGSTKAGAADYSAGQDAILSMSVNGQVYDGITRSNNTFDVDGMKVTLKGTFGEYGQDNSLDALQDYNAPGTTEEQKKAMLEQAKANGVTFSSSTDADKIVDAVKEMVKDYNEMVSEINKAYSTMPELKVNGSRYEPLTDEDMEGMSESAIKNYEEKAKQGLLFGDRDLSNLYSELSSAINSNGKDGAILRSIGIEVSYSKGETVLKLDEEKLRAALENNPDQVKSAFTKTEANGAATDGLMQSLKNQLDRYGSVTGTKGILVEHAGSPRAPSSLHNNSLQELINSYDKQIDRWTTKMSEQVDYYTGKFSRLEMLIAQMNSQSATLAGLMGGMGG